jgi:hypothetical protein
MGFLVETDSWANP